jgi:hypothetical protein
VTATPPGILTPRLGRVRLVAVDGPSGAGKSTFAARLRDEFASRGLSCAIISTDDFATWENPVAWWPRLVSRVLGPLALGEPARYRKLVWTTGGPESGALVTVDPPEVLILEGVSAGRVSVRPRLSWLYWLDGPDARTRLERAVARDGEATRCHLQRWQDFERGWFALDRTREYVHLNGLVLGRQTV